MIHKHCIFYYKDENVDFGVCWGGKCRTYHIDRAGSRVWAYVSATFAYPLNTSPLDTHTYITSH